MFVHYDFFLQLMGIKNKMEILLSYIYTIQEIPDR